MTLNSLIKKLIKNNKGQYAILVTSIIFAVMMIGGYGLIQFSPTVTEVLVAGGSTMQITLSMFAFTVIGTFAFVMYAHSLFLKYKSKEIGVFISLGIKRQNVKKIVVKELTIVVLIATIIGLILSLPLSYLSWTMLTSFISTAETVYRIGWIGLLIGLIFSVVSMAVMIWVTDRYIKKVDIIKILKATEEVEDIKGDQYILGLIGAILIPVGIILFNVAATSNGLFGKLSFVFLGMALVGLYLLIVQITSIGALVKKISPKKYYKNIVFFNLVKLKGKQYTKTLFVTTILVAITIFGVSFNIIPMVDSLLSIPGKPYDYSVIVGHEQKNLGEDEIKVLGEEYNVGLKDFKSFKSIQSGQYSEEYKEWGYNTFISEDEFKNLTGENIDVEEGYFVQFYSMEENAEKHNNDDKESEIEVEFLNSSTQEHFKLKCNTTIYKPDILSANSLYSVSLSVLDNENYDALNNSVEEEFKNTTYMFNVENWKESKEFSDELFNLVVRASDNRWSSNAEYAPIFEINKSLNIEEQEFTEYIYEEIDEAAEIDGASEIMARKWWIYTPFSKCHLFNGMISDGAIYLLLFIYIAVIAFVSAIMIVGIKILNTMWQDKSVYKNITFLGAKRKEIKSIVTKQVMLIYFTPLTLGTIITLFLLKEMLKVMPITYTSEVFLIACIMALIVIIIQIIIFFFIRRKAIKDCMKFEE